MKLLATAQTNTDSLEKLLAKERDEERKVLLYTELTWAFRNKDVDKSLEYGLKGVEIAKKNKYEKLMPKLLNFLGVSYRNRGNYQEALSYFIQTEKMATKTDNQEQVGYALQSIGDIYNRQNNYNLAEVSVMRGLIVFKRIKNEKGIAYCYFSLGLIHDNKKEYYVATDYMQKALNVRLKNNDMLGVAACYSNLGDLASKQQNYEKAIEYLKKSKVMFEKVQDYRGVALTYYRLSENYLRQNQIDTALVAVKNALIASEKSGNLEIIKQCYRQFSVIYALKKDFEQAYQYQVKFFIYGDSLFNQQKNRQFAELSQKYDNEKKALQIALLEGKNENQQVFVLMLGIALISLALFLAVSYRNQKQRKKANLKLQAQTKQIEEKNFSLTTLNEEILSRNKLVETKNKELQQLTQIQNKLFSIISHDFKNPLISLYGSLMIFENDDFGEEEKKIALVALKNELDQTSNLLDNLLHWSLRQMKENKIKTQVFNFQDIVKETFALLKPQTDKKNVSLVNQIENSLLVWADKEMLTMVLRNLLHNAAKYSFENSQIIVFSKIADTKNQVIIGVQDFGRGMNESNMKRLFGLEHYSSSGTAQEKGSGFGLLLCKDFVEKNGGKIWVTSKENEGSIFYFSVPTKHEVSNKTK